MGLDLRVGVRCTKYALCKKNFWISVSGFITEEPRQLYWFFPHLQPKKR